MPACRRTMCAMRSGLGLLLCHLTHGLVPSSTEFPANSGTAPGSFDLDKCENKPTYNNERCPSDTSIACWSAVNATAWTCLSAALANGSRAPSGLLWDVACRSTTDLGSFQGACTFGNGSQTRASVVLLQVMPWAEAREKAEETLALMTLAERRSLLQGIGWHPTKWFFDLEQDWYVGNTPALPRLGIPSLNMQDASAGFRTYWSHYRGTVTVWPSLLSLAATWDPEAVQDFAVAVGKEFAGKGANVILGPSVNVHRVARNGRNFEYLSGEDPYLGSQLSRAYVQGVQSEGVLAVMKHWVFNSQETNRGTQNSIVDAKTAWELYYPPFQAAINAGVSAAMCSYNKIDGTYSCSHKHQLDEILKRRMNFQGFVQSDWWATHNTSLAEGLDQEMPGVAKEVFFSEVNLTGQPLKEVDVAASRILAAMYRLDLGAKAKCTPPNCSRWMERNVTSPEHRALSRSLAADSIVLLKNEDVLPISPGKVSKIAIVGAPAVAKSYDPSGVGQGGGASWHTGDYYSGGGSGHMTGSPVTPLEGLKQRAEAVGIEVLESTSDNVTAGVEAAEQADVVFVVAATTSGESVDRPNLDLDGNASSLIQAVAAVANKTVVLLQIPGAVVMPWHDEVSAILALFLGGQETGSAWADVVFGDVEPSGRLPIMMPVSENDTIAPSEEATIVYSEGLETSYRNTSFQATFPFGHGLTYTTFEYSGINSSACSVGSNASRSSLEFFDQDAAFLCIMVTVRNSGSRAGRAVPQLYLDLQDSEQPVAILKGFQKTAVLHPGSTTRIAFPLTKKDLSYYSAGSDDWIMAGDVTAYVGESSADKSLSLEFLVEAETESGTAQPGGDHSSGSIALSCWLGAVLAMCSAYWQ